MLYPLVWRAVDYCEGFASVVSDKASGNQKLYRILFPEQDVNVFCGEEERPLFLFSDPEHLVKYPKIFQYLW